VLFCWQDGRPPHPDTITRRFKKLAAAAGLPEIDWKALSKRIGHADVAYGTPAGSALTAQRVSRRPLAPAKRQAGDGPYEDPEEHVAAHDPDHDAHARAQGHPRVDGYLAR
jgi:hypothetical protein